MVLLIFASQEQVVLLGLHDFKELAHFVEIWEDESAGGIEFGEVKHLHSEVELLVLQVVHFFLRDYGVQNVHVDLRGENAQSLLVVVDAVDVVGEPVHLNEVLELQQPLIVVDYLLLEVHKYSVEGRGVDVEIDEVALVRTELREHLNRVLETHLDVLVEFLFQFGSLRSKVGPNLDDLVLIQVGNTVFETTLQLLVVLPDVHKSDLIERVHELDDIP